MHLLLVVFSHPLRDPIMKSQDIDLASFSIEAMKWLWLAVLRDLFDTAAID
jgi:hypothetical protein